MYEISTRYEKHWSPSKYKCQHSSHKNLKTNYSPSLGVDEGVSWRQNVKVFNLYKVRISILNNFRCLLYNRIVCLRMQSVCLKSAHCRRLSNTSGFWKNYFLNVWFRYEKIHELILYPKITVNLSRQSTMLCTRYSIWSETIQLLTYL